MINLEKKGVREIDLSHWSFTNIRFDESFMKLTEFADKINFRNAYFCHSIFYQQQMKNTDFSRVCFDKCHILLSTFRNCNFNGAVFKEADSEIDRNTIHKSTYIKCNFKKAQLNNTMSSKNKFFACSFRGVNEVKQRTSIRDKLIGYLKEVKSRNADRADKQREDRQEER